jgi:hypothetical protein
VLSAGIPAAIQENVESSRAHAVAIDATVRGCSADDVLHLDGDEGMRMDFRVELDVWKVNVCFWTEGTDLPDALDENVPQVAAFRHVISGARREGYDLNPAPATWSDVSPRQGLLFAKTLPEDVLFEPARRLYFTQDLSFFVRGMLEALRSRRYAAA